MIVYEVIMRPTLLFCLISFLFSIGLAGATEEAASANSCLKFENEREVYLCGVKRSWETQECIENCYKRFEECRIRENKDSRDYHCVRKLSSCSDRCRFLF